MFKVGDRVLWFGDSGTIVEDTGVVCAVDGRIFLFQKDGRTDSSLAFESRFKPIEEAYGSMEFDI